jgi:uncharacterized protein (DUF1810 family)
MATPAERERNERALHEFSRPMDDMAEPDPHRLERFVEAQRGSFQQAADELRRGAKRTHWMWYVFPQIAGLGSSATAQHYAIQSLEEARAFLRHPVLGGRYLECVAILQDLTGTTAERVFGSVDAMKLRSSLTLFSRAGAPPIVDAALARWFGGPDEATLRVLAKG